MKIRDTIRQSGALVLFTGTIIALFIILIPSGTKKTKKTNKLKDLIIQKVFTSKNDDDCCYQYTAKTGVTCDEYCSKENLYSHCLADRKNCYEDDYAIHCACTSSNECAPTPSPACP